MNHAQLKNYTYLRHHEHVILTTLAITGQTITAIRYLLDILRARTDTATACGTNPLGAARRYYDANYQQYEPKHLSIRINPSTVPHPRDPVVTDTVTT